MRCGASQRLFARQSRAVRSEPGPRTCGRNEPTRLARAPGDTRRRRVWAGLAPAHTSRQSGLLALRVLEPALRIGGVRERPEGAPVVAVDAVAERELRSLEEPAHRLLGDVDHVVTEPAAVRPALVVARENAHAIGLRGHRDREVDAEQIRKSRSRVVELRHAGEQNRDEVVTAGLRSSELVELVDDRCEDRRRVVLLETPFLHRLERVPLVLEARRDDDLVDQRVRKAVDLDPAARVPGSPAASRHLAPVDGRPDADGAVLRAQARDGNLHAERVDAIAGEEVLAAAHVSRALADRDEIEDRADVTEERIVTLTGERAPSTCDGHDALRGERAVARSRARPDVVRRSRSTGNDLRLPAG